MKPFRRLRAIAILGGLGLLVATASCDLDVTNPNEPDRARALGTPGDVQSLVGATFHSWWNSNHQLFGANETAVGYLSSASFQHSCWPANFGCVEYSSFPRGELVNSTADAFYVNLENIWNLNYSALSAVSKGLRAVEENPEFAEDLDTERLRAFGKFVQGLAHASIALIYDQGHVIDETVDTDDPDADPELLPYDELMERAVGPGGYFDQAIEIASGADFTTPVGWMSKEVDAQTLVELAHAYKARYMASVARSPEERENVDWAAVLEEIDAGLDEFELELDDGFDTDVFSAQVQQWMFSLWNQANYFILGMADQSGDYQRWLDQPIQDRIPNPGEEPVLIRTPDERFAQGETLEEQIANPGAYFAVPDAEDSPCASSAFSLGNSFAQPARGTWRWSYYFDIGFPGCNFENFASPGSWPIIKPAEMRLLEAEARLRMGQEDAAAALVNESRMAHGLDDASEDSDLDGNPNDDCVPRLPDETCGDLMEMLKWEKRLETKFHGLHSNSWYFDGRGWGDLFQGTFLSHPIPEEDLLLLGIPVYTTGSPGAPASVYEWPGES